MKIFVDENIPNVTVLELQTLGHDVLDIRGTPRQGMLDDELWALAQSEQRRLVTTDKGFTAHREEDHWGNFGVACLGGECFGEAGAGFLRFSCAEPNDRLQQAVDFIPVALSRTDRIAAYLETHPQFRLTTPYAVEG